MAVFKMVYLLLLMTSNDFARASELASTADKRLEIGSGVNSNDMLQSRAGGMSKSEVQALLSKTFAEPLPVVMNRVKKTVAAMPLREAVTRVGHKLSSDVHAFIEQPNSTQAPQSQVSVKSHDSASATVGLGSLHQPGVFDKAMAFMNEQIKIAREKMDIKLFECGFFKLEKEGLLYETQDILDEIAQDISLAEATIEKCQGEIAELNLELSKKREELSEHLAWCAKIRAGLEAEKAVIEEDLRVIDLIRDTTVEECKDKVKPPFLIQACVSADGTTDFETTNQGLQDSASKLQSVSAQKAFQLMLFQAYGGLGAALPGKVDLLGLTGADEDTSDDDDIGFDNVPHPDSLMETGSKLEQIRAAPSAATKNVAPASLRGKKCPVGAKPNCPVLLDKLDQMRGEIIDQLTQKTKELEAHNTWCQQITDGLNMEITTLLNQLTVWNTELARATGQLGALQIAQREHQLIKHQLCEELREKYEECYKDLKALEREICGLMKIRQAVYNRVKAPGLKPGDPQIVIQDCEMGDWVVGPCSSTCLDANGNPGQQLITRSPAVKWDPTTPEGKYGMECPPGLVSRDCSNVACPIDCTMGDWSGWSKCSKDCGGGQQGRSRPVEQDALFGGKECPGTSEERLCNTDSCDQDCVLSDWGGWGPCSKACKFRSTAKPGSQTRSKGVRIAAKGGGKCPMPKTRERFQFQQCNDFSCPKDVKCVADMDIMILIDGSGSLYYRYKPIDRNWELSKKFVLDLISMSKMAKMDDVGRAKGGLRYGVVLFSFGAVTVSPITHKKDDLLTKVKAMKWPRGWTMTDKGLLKAKAEFGVSGTLRRQQVVVILTDGRASNKWKTRKAAKEVRSAGIRVILVPVKNAVRVKKEMCRWASKPCNENMLMTPSWKMLISKIRWYLTSLCPVIEAP